MCFGCFCAFFDGMMWICFPFPEFVGPLIGFWKHTLGQSINFGQKVACVRACVSLNFYFIYFYLSGLFFSAGLDEWIDSSGHSNKVFKERIIGSFREKLATNHKPFWWGERLHCGLHSVGLQRANLGVQHSELVSVAVQVDGQRQAEGCLF